MMIKGNDPANIRPNSTLSTDEFSSERFDFMLSNPPYGKSWASEQKYIKDGAMVIDPRFKVELKDYWGQLQPADAAPRSSDGQLLFLMEMVSKIKRLDESPLGSRIASVHNGSSLFTGDAGSGESNIRRHIIENDLLEAIIQLPNNLFYNTGITTYIWLLSNNKTEHRKGKVQLIDASKQFQKLRKNLGNKNCEFAPRHIRDIVKTYLNMESIEPDNPDHDDLAARVFENTDFGYYKVAIERPDRRKARFSADRIAPLRFDKALAEPMQWIYDQFKDAVYTPGTLDDNGKEILAFCDDQGVNLNARNRKRLLNKDTWQKYLKLIETAQLLMAEIGEEEFDDFNHFKILVDKTLKTIKKSVSATEKKSILDAVSWYDENACKVIKKKIKLPKDKLEILLQHLGCHENGLPDFGYYPSDTQSGKKGEYLTYEPCSDLRDHESVPLKDEIHRYFKAEIVPHVPEAWINLDSVKIGYEISFNKYFYCHKPLAHHGRSSQRYPDA
jgi:type I restriction enzyme M protein